MIRRPISSFRHYALQQHRSITQNIKVPFARFIVSHTHAGNRPLVTSPHHMSMNEISSKTVCMTLDDAIVRSKNSPDVQAIVLELPEVPPIPSKKRTFHLAHDDLETLVRPLLSCHWYVGRVKDGVNGLEVLSLNKLFSFKTFSSAVEFFDALAGFQNEENHHARITVDYNHVYVSTHTHCAYQNAVDAGDGAKPIKAPGLTSRDIRLAVKVEGLHGTYLREERAVTKVPVDSESLQALSMEQLRRRYPAQVA